MQSLAHNVHYYRPQRSWAKVIFLHVSVILLTGGVSPNFWGGSKFSGGSPILGGVSPIFRGGRCLQFFGGSPNFFLFFKFFFFFKFFSPKISSEMHQPPSLRWSMHGWYASYWNAFLFLNKFIYLVKRSSVVIFKIFTENEILSFSIPTAILLNDNWLFYVYSCFVFIISFPASPVLDLLWNSVWYFYMN